jgi:hypothetical protein
MYGVYTDTRVVGLVVSTSMWWLLILASGMKGRVILAVLLMSALMLLRA